MFKKILIFILLLFLQFFLGIKVFAEQVSVEDVFSDINVDYKYHKELQALFDRGMIFPDENKKFNPQKLLNRDEFVGIAMEIICKRCIAPNTNFEFIEKYSDTKPFYDVYKTNKYFYCVSESDNKGFVKGYNKGFKCENGQFKSNERPFCIDNTIILEEALAVILRMSNIFTVEDNKKVLQKIYSGELTDKLADDLYVKNNNGTPYTFYGYFKKALSYKIIEFDNNGNEISYSLLEKKNGKLRPKKRMSKEDFLKIAYVLSRANSCIDNEIYNIPVRINILNKICIKGKECLNKEITPKEKTFDLVGKVFSACDKGLSNKGYIWKFYHIKTGKEIIKKEKYIDNYAFLEKGKWKIDLNVIDNCGNKGIASSTISISDESVEKSEMGLKIAANPLIGKKELKVDFSGIVEGGTGKYTYKWFFGDGKIGEGKNPSHIYIKSGEYRVKLVVKDDMGNKSEAYITIVILPKNGNSKYLGVGIESNLLRPLVKENVKFIGIVDGGTGNYTYKWDFGDGIDGIGEELNHEYISTGKYIVKLRVVDSDGNIGYSSISEVVVNKGKKIKKDLGLKIETTQLYGGEGMNVRFNGIAEGGTGNYSYEWDFGDGKKGTGKRPSHIYGTSGKYRVELTVMDSEGNKSTVYTTIVVVKKDGKVNDLGVKVYTDKLLPEIGQKVNFIGEVNGGTGVYTYKWDFGDGKKGVGKKTNHVYSNSGKYMVKLLVIDSEGGRGKASVIEISLNKGEKIKKHIGVRIEATPLYGKEGMDISFNGIAGGGTGNYTYEWDFLDGTEGVGKNPNHVYSNSGKYRVKLIVTDNEGNKSEAYTTIIVVPKDGEGKDLGVVIKTDPVIGEEGVNVNFTGISDGGVGNYIYKWDFGDGTKGVGKNSDHTYEDSGKYIVKLLVEDGEGNIGKASVVEVIVPKKDTFKKDLGVEIEATLLYLEAGKNVDFNGVVEGGTGNYKYEWDYGDGTKGVGKKSNHIYENPGKYRVKLIVTDDNGNKGTAYITVVVANNGEGNNLGVSIKASPLKGEVGMNVDFNGVVEGGTGTYIYKWDFGDGIKGTGKTSDHIYNAVGSHRVTLIVTDGEGKTGVATVIIVVVEKNVDDNSGSSGLGVGIHVVPRVLFVTEKVDFEGLVEGGDGNYTYEWNFGDGKAGEGKNPIHRYIKDGIYIATVKITDGTGKTGFSEVSINVKKIGDVNNDKMGVEIDANPKKCDTGVSIDFEGLIEGGNPSYSYLWEFGDGETGVGKKPKHSFKQNGSYIVKMFVEDINGNSGIASVQIEVADKKIENEEDNGLTVQAESDVSEGKSKLVVNFNGIVSGGTGKYTYLWHFGDGENGHLKEVNHTFINPMLYPVKLSVVDSAGNTGDVTLSINVFDADSCLVDSDGDGVMDCNDKLPNIPGDKENEGVPILDDKCGEGCSCQEGYVCTSDNPETCSEKGVCKPKQKSLNPCLEEEKKALIYGNAVCLSCPCSYSLNFNESIRKCDMIFPAITSPDSKTIYSRGKIFKVK